MAIKLRAENEYILADIRQRLLFTIFGSTESLMNLNPALRGKLLFGDITGGRIWGAEMKMLAADDGDPKSMAHIHEVAIN